MWYTERYVKKISTDSDDLTILVSGFVDELENAELVLLRIEALLQGIGVDLAHRLINRFVRVKGADVRLMSMLLIILHNTDQCDEFHRQASCSSLLSGCSVM